MLVIFLIVRTSAALLGGLVASVLGGLFVGAAIAVEFLARAAALAVDAVFLPVDGFPNLANHNLESRLAFLAAASSIIHLIRQPLIKIEWSCVSKVLDIGILT